MHCKDLQAILEQEGLSPLPLEAQEHLADCLNCQDLFADLSAIVVAARQLPAEANPPDRVWISLRAQLAAEGIIREEVPVELAASAPWWQSFSQFFRPRILASVGAAVLVVVGGIYFRQHDPESAQNNSVPLQPRTARVNKAAEVIPSAPPTEQPTRVPSGKNESAAPHSHRVIVPPPREVAKELKPSPSENAFLGETAGVLDQTESALREGALTSNAMADASLRTNLDTLNAFIAECKARLAQNPQDQLTREYLNAAYQQKAELLTAMMDSRRSEH